MNMNSVFISGRVSRIDEMKISPKSGTAYISFGVGCNRMSKDQGADFFNFIAFGKTAEFVADHLSKGDQLIVNGRLQNDQWEENGKKRTATKIIVNGIDKMWPPKQQEGASPEQQEGASPVSGGLQESSFDFNG